MTEPLSPSALAMTRPVAVLGRAGLAHAVAMATLTVDRKNTLPILSNLRLRGDGENLAVIGTDMDIEIHASVAGAADSRLDVTVPAHMLKDILSKAKDSELASLDQVEHEDSFRCGVDLGGVKFNLHALPASDFPVVQPVGTESRCHDFEVDSEVLAEMLSKVSFAISTEETRYYLNGVFLQYHAATNGLRAVATDGHRLATMHIDSPDGAIDMPGAIVPRKAVKLLLDIIKAERRAAGGALGPVTVAVEERRIAFCVGSVTVTSKLVDGTFPDYERVTPQSGDEAGFSVKALSDAVKQVSLISAERGRAVRFEVSHDSAVLSCNNPDAGKAETTIGVSRWNGGPLAIGFNSYYLLDALAQIEAESVVFRFIDHGSPAVITDPADPRFMSVIMPMRT